MTDQPGQPGPEERLPAPRPETPPAPVERFTSPPGTRKFELTPERAAMIVRQSSNARWVSFLAVIIVVLFVALYWFYELGAPLGLTQPRLEAERDAQAVLSVERGYNIYEANCARCHGANGEGGIGPVLNRQDKLFQHLNEAYLHNILLVGGRYACGNANSQMPVWSNEGTPPGPLNYVQIEELIAFIRAENTQTFTKRDPELLEPRIDPVTGEVETFTGWVDPNYQPEPNATPFPDCWQDEFLSESPAPAGSGEPPASAEPSGAPAPSGSAAPSSPAPAGSPAAGGSVQIVASGIQFTTTDVEAPAGQDFTIEFDNQDANVPHDVDIRDASGNVVEDSAPFTGAGVEEIPVTALEAGTYTFFCSVHPNMTGTLTAQ
ncbi:MAG TPA: cupredoxin domain-containing protein [Candidatus Limnocylindrales bacterium]|nr:cupredoxin domain-containing protein [Candidatus Limnocylindrales bacterium]